MKILFLPKHEYLAASTRYRTIQYLSYIKDKNIEFNVSPLFSDEYLKFKYENGTENKLITLRRILKRIKIILFDAQQYELLVIEKELIPYFPPLLECYLKLKKIHFIVDYDDAIWHNYDNHRNFLVRVLLKNKIKIVMNQADTIIAGSKYIVDYAKNTLCRNIVKIPTVIDIKRYKCNETSIKETLFVIGWIGSPSTSQYILDIDKMLKEFTDKHNAIVHLVGFDKALSSQLHFKYRIVPWNESSEIDEICKFSVGIMPLPDTPFERGKCGFKLIQYMGCKKAVIASPIGENNIIVSHGVNGFLARDYDSWLEHLLFFYQNRLKGIEFGNQGFNTVQQAYSLGVGQEKYYQALTSVDKEVL